MRALVNMMIEIHISNHQSRHTDNKCFAFNRFYIFETKLGHVAKHVGKAGRHQSDFNKCCLKIHVSNIICSNSCKFEFQTFQKLKKCRNRLNIDEFTVIWRWWEVVPVLSQNPRQQSESSKTWKFESWTFQNIKIFEKRLKLVILGALKVSHIELSNFFQIGYFLANRAPPRFWQWAGSDGALPHG